MNYIKNLLAVLVIFLSTSVFGAQERYSSRLEGINIVQWASLEIYDDKYFEMDTDPSWTARYSNYKVSNKITLGLNKEEYQTTSFAEVNGWVKLRISYDVWTGSNFVSTNIVKQLAVSYNTNGLQIIDDLSSVVFSGGHHITCTIIDLSVNLPVSKVYIESEINVERYYTFDGTAVSGVSHAITGTNSDYIDFSWNTKVGAEFYELEWVHINDYKMSDDADFFTTSELNFNYYLNSTRVTIKSNHYTIPKIFDRGYLLFRVRAIGVQTTNFSVRKDGDWNVVESDLVSNHPTNQIIPISAEYDAKMNWSHQVGYTEEGKRMEVISFADGLGRGRQSVAHNTVTKQAVVSNVYYDELGRPVISDLPTPMDGEKLQHYRDFNQVDNGGTLESFSKDNFDVPDPTGCYPGSQPLSTASGSGNYYSDQNLNNQNENANIPNAEGFPYSRVQYVDDFSGRIARVGAAGATLKVGGGHETKMFYPSTNQAELNKLFGSEIGYKDHYQKLVTVDANGQVYVQYMDMAGRKIASYMAGNSPTNVDALDENGGVNTTVPLITNGTGQDITDTPPSASLTYTEYITASGLDTFNYEFTPIQYTSLCMQQDVCLDCVYDLMLRITDECGEEKWADTIVINGGVLDSTCNGTYPFILPEVILDLVEGEYTIYKELSVNQQAMEDYWCFYLDGNSCIEPISDLFNELYNQNDFINCVDEVEDISDLDADDVNICSQMKQIMLGDVSPGGQYGTYNIATDGTYFVSDPTSELFDPNILDGVNTAKYTTPNSPYVNEDGTSPCLVYSPILNATVEPQLLPLKDFILSFATHPRWAESLLSDHPEFCYLTFCEANNASRAYDQAMKNVHTYDEAEAAGYLRPLGTVFTPPSPYNTLPTVTTGLDPFFTSPNYGANAPFPAQMTDKMVNYANYGTMHSMWQAAMFNVNGLSTNLDTPVEQIPSDCDKDMMWLAFREIYLEQKAMIYFAAQEAYAVENGCSNNYIGSTPYSVFPPTNPLYANKQSRWGNLSLYNSLLDDPSTVQSETETEVVNQVAAGCETACTQYAADWISSLSGCDIAANIQVGTIDDMKADFIELCTSGCDQNHPMGATTTPSGTTATNNGYSFNDVDDILAHYLGNNYQTSLCNQYLISEPGIYREINLDNAGEKPLDECSCDKILQAEWDFENLSVLPDGVTSIEAMVAYSTGVSLEDVDFLICGCKKATLVGNVPVDNGYIPNQPQNWNENAQAIWNRSEITVPEELSCPSDGTGCIPCSKITTDLNNIVNEFNPVLTPETDNYELIVANYLNNLYNFTLSYSDYNIFISGCTATPASPSCQTNPLVKEWASVMNLITHRGTLLNTSTSSVDLISQNIVYANGQLKDLFSGNSYWTSTTGVENQMEFDFGTVSGTHCTVTLNLPALATFGFDDIVEFGDVYPSTVGCENPNSTFEVEVSYFECGQLETTLLTGSSDCFEINLCFCGNEGQVLCNAPLFNIDEFCYQPDLDQMYQTALELYEQQIEDQYAIYVADYNAKCSEAFATENFSYTGPVNTYQYTLFYYDQAGNLVETVAPQGVNLLPSADNDVIDENRDLVASANVYQVPEQAPATHPTTPTHYYKTKYAYNSYNQLVETTNPDQDGVTKYWYDRIGRIIASQNPVQEEENKYSYSLYDKQSRTIEEGQVEIIDILTEVITQKDDLGVSFTNWVNSGTKSEITRTYYDRSYVPTGSPAGTFSLIPDKFANHLQENLRLRVASVLYFENGIDVNYTSAIHYSYDVHGNIREQLQDVPMMLAVKQDIKSTQYEYELISGKVQKVSYQKGEPDYYTHIYNYDELNRLTEVHTTTNDVHKTQEVHYRYYDYGLLARTEIGEYKVQGNDFVYTINGLLKGMNSSTLNTSRDIGHDGVIGYLQNNNAVHTEFARDVLGYTLGYFSGDYSAIGISTMEANYLSENEFNLGSTNLYNGDIRNIVTSIEKMPTMGTTYRYDQLQRLKVMDAYYMSSPTANDWTASTHTDDYHNEYTYDRNGNIQTLKRNGTLSIGLNMDDFVYKYEETINGGYNNRLSWVDDQAGASIYADADIDQSMNTGNYVYDKLGQLVKDTDEGIESIEWRTGDKKIKRMIRTASNQNSSEMEFIYNPFGQRIVKIEKPRLNGDFLPMVDWKYSYYTYDANGQVMAIYNATISSTQLKANLEERNIYGAGRIGILKDQVHLFNNGIITFTPTETIQNTLGNRQYEISNHLGNVNAVVTDRKTVEVGGASSIYIATLVHTADFYPFGQEMPERIDKGLTGIKDYRFGYNGMEFDNEVKGTGNSYTTEFRQYDPRLGRWLSLDPLMAMFPSESPYCAFANNPVYYIDPYGLSAGGPEGEEDPLNANPNAGSEMYDGYQQEQPLPYHDWIDEGLKEKKQWAFSSAAYFDKENNQVSFSRMDKLEGHGSDAFNSYHFNRVTNFYYQNAKKENSGASVGIGNDDWKQCVQSASYGVNALYDLQGDKKIPVHTAMQDANNGEKGLMTTVKERGLAGKEKTFTAVDANGSAIHNSKGVATTFNNDPLQWAKDVTDPNGVGVFLVSAMNGYHSLTLIVDRRGPDVTYRLLDQHATTASGFDRTIAHTKQEVNAYLIQMAVDWTSASYLNSNYTLLQLKRD